MTLSAFLWADALMPIPFLAIGLGIGLVVWWLCDTSAVVEDITCPCGKVRLSKVHCLDDQDVDRLRAGMERNCAVCRENSAREELEDVGGGLPDWCTVSHPFTVDETIPAGTKLRFVITAVDYNPSPNKITLRRAPIGPPSDSPPRSGSHIDPSLVWDKPELVTGGCDEHAR